MSIEEQTNIDAASHLGEVEHAEPRPGSGSYFGEVVRARVQRRAFLQGVGVGVGLVALPVLAPRPAHASGRDAGAALRFSPIAPTGIDDVVVPDHYASDVVIR